MSIIGQDGFVDEKPPAVWRGKVLKSVLIFGFTWDGQR
jgi:hypothetical protein